MEGPQNQLYARQLAELTGRHVVRLGGDRRDAVGEIVGRRIEGVTALGKLLFIHFASDDDDQLIHLRLHCLMFGDVRINRTRPGKRLTLRMTLDEATKVYLYLGAARMATTDEVDPDVLSRDIAGGNNPTDDVMRRAAAARPDGLVCDVLLDQHWFPGLGNKIKCEALHRARVHPAVAMKNLSDDQFESLAFHSRDFTAHFESVIFRDGDRGTPDYKIFRKRKCGTCGGKVLNEKLGELERSCHYCPDCQTVG